jgi:hypothetical protein
MTTSRNLILIILTLIFYSCSDSKKKEELWKTFCAFQTRNIPASIAHFDKLNDFDIVYQDKNTIGNRYNYPNTYVIGLYNNDKRSYDRTHTIEGFLPKDHYQLIKTTSDFYATDTTYLDNIQYTDTIYIDNKNISSLKDTMYCISKDDIQSSYKMNSKKYIVMIFRKTNKLKRDRTIGEYEMWKREIIRLEGDKIKTELIEQMNEHAF